MPIPKNTMIDIDVTRDPGDDLLNSLLDKLNDEVIKPMANGARTAGKLKPTTSVLTYSYAVRKIVQAFICGFRYARRQFS